MDIEHHFLSLLTGSFASPADENPTVAMIEAAYRALGLNARYVNCDVPAAMLGDAVRGARAMGWVGFNCSIPHKLAVIEHLDALAPSAALIGAVNCVVLREGRLVGENTDGQGFLDSLRTVAEPNGSRVTLFGAGGAARAIAVELALAGAARITIVNRRAEPARELAELIAQRTGAQVSSVPWTPYHRVDRNADIVVNATSVGLFPNVNAMPDLDTDSLHAGMVVADVIPNPPRTALIEAATQRGCVTLDGLGMLVNQGLISIAHWTGRTADAAVMRATLEGLFSP